MPKEPSTSRHYCLASRVFSRGRIMSLPYTSCRRNGVSCVVDVVSGRCNCCLEKNIKCSLVVTQGDCESPLGIFFCFSSPLLIVF